MCTLYTTNLSRLMDLDVGRKLGESRLALVSHFPLRYGESVGGLDSD